MDETVNQGAQERTFTQTELDKIVGERLAREREKYADYDAIKEKASKLDSMEEASKSELQKITEKATALETELNALKKEKEVETLRRNVSKETGVPENLLTGQTEEECKEQAQAIKAFADPGYPSVKDQAPQNAPSGTAKEQFAEWARQVFNE